MNPNVIAALAEAEIASSESIEGCINNDTPAMDGTGSHLGLRTPWWNDKIHELTDTTLFRWLMLFVVVHYVYNNFLR